MAVKDCDGSSNHSNGLLDDSNGSSKSDTSKGPVGHSSPHPSPGRTDLPEILACFSAITFHFALGLTLAYSAVLLPQLERPDSDLPITKHEAAWIASVVALAVPLGSLVTGPIMEALGRLRTVQMATVPFCVGCVLIATASSVHALIAGRFFTGLSAGTIGTNPGIVYVTEVARPSMRGSLISTAPFMVSVGTMAMYVLGAYVQWRMLAWVCFCAPLLPLVCMAMWSSESPAWLVSKGRALQAQRSLAFLSRRDPARLLRVELEVSDLVSAQAARASTEHRGLAGFLGAVFLQRSGLRPLIVLTLLFALQQFAGIYVALFYAVSFFKDVESALDPNVASMLVGGIRVVMSVVAVVLLRRFGRRPLLMVSGFFCAVCLLTSGYFAKINPPGLSNHSGYAVGENASLYVNDLAAQPAYSGWIPVGAILAFVSFSMVGLLTIPWTMTAELFPARVRGLCQGLSVSLANVFMFLAVQSYSDLSASLGGVWAVHWVYASVCLVAVVYVYLFVPETHGRTLAQIEEYFQTSVVYPWFVRRQRRSQEDFVVNSAPGDVESSPRPASGDGATRSLLRVRVAL